MWRDVFLYTTNPEVFLDSGNVRSLLRRSGLSTGDGTHASLNSALAALHSELEASRQAWTVLWDVARSTHTRADLMHVVIAQSAPLAASLGAWLQGLSAPGVFEDEVQLKALALLADDVGVGRPEASRHDAFRIIARRAGLSEYAVPLRDILSVRAIRDSMFCLPGLLHALSRCSARFAPELAGIDLAFRTAGLIPAWQTAAAEAAGEPEWARLDLSEAQGTALPAGHGPQSLSALIAGRYARAPEALQRVCDGIGWLNRGLAQWDRDLRDICRAAIDPHLAMALLVQERARQAGVYHNDFELEGKSLALWFKEAVADPLPLVEALARSRLVRPGEPERSALINTLIRPSGPMFRVFRNEDIAVVRRWIASLLAPGGKGKADPKPEAPLPSAILPARAPVGQGDRHLGPVPATIREAYYLLQGRALAPRTREFAADYVRKRLELSNASIGKTDRSLPDEWSPWRLRAWLLDEHDKRGVEFEQHRFDEVPSREEAIDSTLQLAPLILIDGAWLQGFTECALATTRIGFPLFETYWDELGNGEYELNHPKIYRDLLLAMGIELPPTGSMEFALDERLRDESFRLPVYWLCLGKFPVTFRAETLGMNLAMELSGVGGSYRSARRFLKHYGFPTRFVDIHNTIDNVSTGHSAWAADAIDAYMRTVSDYADPDAAWERVRAGYESLAPIVKRDTDLDYFRTPAAPRRSMTFDAETYHHTPAPAST